MQQHEAFLQAILEEPDADAPRLIFADWLDDQGESDRAEFIRTQCLLADLPAHDPRQAELERQTTLLLAEHEQRWTRELRGRVAYWAFHRGFVEEVGARTAGFVEHSSVLFQLAPLREVHLWAHTPIPLLADCPYLGRLRHLDLSGSPLREGDVRALVESPHLAGLHGLNLSSTNLGDTAARLLARSPHLAELRELYLFGNPIGDEGAWALAVSPHLCRLKVLYLDFNPGMGSSRGGLLQRFGPAGHFLPGREG
jgi:uncharacterized protein (TIGR02996 family)